MTAAVKRHHYFRACDSPQSVAAPMELPNAQDRTYDSKRWLHHSSSDMSRVLNALAFLFLYVRGFAPQLKWLICTDA
jgi:hypothetical protein